jgi:hypothetical protein
MSMSELTPEAQARLREAVRTAIAREDRTESPRGEWRDRLWYPADDERQDCCENITPTEGNRQALESHCRTQAHVARLFKVPRGELRREVRLARELEELASRPPVRLHPLPSSRGGRADVLLQASQGAHSDALQDLRAEALRFASILSRLIDAPDPEPGEDLLELLIEAEDGMERLQVTIEYCRQAATSYDSARAIRDLISRLSEQGED